MSLVAGSIAITFKTLNKEFGRGVDEVKGKLGGLKSAAGGAAKTMGVALGGAAVAGVGALATTAGVAVAKYGEFETLLTNVSTLISGDATDALESYKDGILDITKSVPKSPDELGAGLYDIVSAGIEGTNAQLGTLKSSAKLAVAGLGDTAGAVDLMTSSINAFGLDAENSDKIADTLFKTVKFGKTTVDGLRQGFGGVAPSAAAAGVKLEELMAATSALTTTGLPAAEAYTQLKASFGELTKPGTALKKQLESIGIENAKAAIESEGYDTVLKKLYESVGNDEVALKNLFGSMEAGSAAVGLVSTVSDAYTSTLHEMKEGSDALNEANEKQNATWGNFIQLLQNQASAALIELGSVLVPLLMDGMTKLQEIVVPLYQGLKDYFSTFEVQMGTIKPLFELLWTSMQEIFEQIKPYLKEAFNQFKDIIGQVVDTFNFAMPYIVQIVKYMMDKIRPIIKRITDEIFPLIKPAIEAMLGAFKAILPFLMPIFKFMIDHVSNTINLIITIIKGFIQVATGLLQLIEGIFTVNFRKMGEGIKNIFSGIFNGVAGIIMYGIRSIASSINRGIRAVNVLIGNMPSIPGIGSIPSIPEIPAFADGVRNFSGGLAIVGEEGPELVSLPRGADVYSNDESKKMAGGSKVVKVYLTINSLLPDEETIDTAIDTLIPKLKNRLN